MAQKTASVDPKKLRNFIDELSIEWNDQLQELAQAKNELKSRDLFGAIEYLTACDQLYKMISDNIQEINSHLTAIKADKTQKEAADLEMDLKKLKNEMVKKAKEFDEEYPILAEKTLRGTQDLITKYSKAIYQERTTPTLRTAINQNLEKESLLEELRDALENYREVREDLVEKPEEDEIVAELETAITSCDEALLIKETSE